MRAIFSVDRFQSFLFKIWNVSLDLVQILTPSKIFMHKIWFLWVFEFLIWGSVIFLFQILTRCKNVFQNKARRKFTILISCFSKRHKNCKIGRFHVATLFKNVSSNANFYSNSDSFWIFRNKIWNPSKVFVQILMPCKNLKQKNWLFVIFWNPIVTHFKISNSKSHVFLRGTEKAKNVVFTD